MVFSSLGEDIHRPVLPEEVLHWLAPHAGGIYVDGNLGLGGHAALILEQSAPDGRLIGFEWDRTTLELARARLAPYGERVRLMQRNFAELPATLTDLGIERLDGLLLDLGLSSWQLEASGRGFSFKGCEPLDMRMDERQEITAAKLLNSAPQEELADIFYHYGEERQARRIAAAVVAAREKGPLETTADLVKIVERAVPRRFHPRNIHVATRVFQALRIAVNQELHNLSAILKTGASCLRPGARFCVISFHSLEDRLVKQAFLADPGLEVLTRKPVIPDARELEGNPRARSAKLRVAAARGEGHAA